MKVFNNTADKVEYILTSSTLEHAGWVEAGQTADEPSFDNQQGVTASLTNGSGGDAFNITIPESKEGMTVTIGIYFE
jgi:hypothetical protein